MVAPFASKNVFDLGFPAQFSGNMGKIYPNYYEEVYPGDHLRCYDENITKLAPLVGPVYGFYDVYQWYFFVPWRLVYKDWQAYITGGKYGNDSPNQNGSNPYVKPYVLLNNPSHKSLAAYFGMASQQTYPDQTTYSPGQYKVDAMPFRAYQLIWNEWFRNENLQDEVEISLDGGEDQTINTTNVLSKNWERDRFTSALPWQQRGDPTYLPLDIEAPVFGKSKVPMRMTTYYGENYGTTNNGNLMEFHHAHDGYQRNYLGVTTSINNDTQFNSDEGSMRTNISTKEKIQALGLTNAGVYADLTKATAVTVDQVRTAFQIQLFLYNSGRRGYRYVEQILSLFGVRAPDASLQRPEFIGGYRSPLNISEVIQTSETTNSSPQGNVSGIGRSWARKLGFNKRFNEYGCVIGLWCCMPKTMYNGQGIPKVFTRETKYDYLVPPLAHLSMDAVKNKELYVTGTEATDNAVFGYQDRYDELRHRVGTIAGDFLTSLNFWTNSRIFANAPALNSAFVTCNPDYRQFAVTDDTVDHLWVTTYHDVKAVRPLPKHGNPGYIDHM